MPKILNSINRHLHNQERWFEPRAVVTGEVTVGVEFGTRNNAIYNWQLDAGDNTWCAWTIILGSGDTPCASLPGKKYFDIHKVGIQACERTTEYHLQLGFGTVAGGVLTGKYSDIWFNSVSVSGKTESIAIVSSRYPVGTKVWMRVVCPGYDTATIDFKIAGHFSLV